MLLKTIFYFFACLAPLVYANDAPLEAEKALDAEETDYQILIFGQQNVKADSAVSATKFELPILLIPQSISVITEDVIESQQASTVADILKNDASINQLASTAGRQRFTARGFELSAKGNYLRNGQLYWFYDLPPAELLERVEIIKGPSAIYGPGAPGATINLITKMPVYEPFYAIEGSLGSYDEYRVHGDIGGPLGNHSAYRANAVIKDANSFREHIFTERQAGLLTLDWQSPNDTLFNIYVDALHDKRPQDSGLVAINQAVADVPRSKVFNAPWAIQDATTINAGTTIDKAFSHAWHLEASVSFQHLLRDRTNTNVRKLQDNGDFELEYQRRRDRWHYYATTVDFLNSQPRFGLDNQLLLGLNYIHNTHRQIATSRLSLGQFNIFDPIQFPNNPKLPFSSSTGYDANTLGLYLQDILSLNQRWDLMTGVRYNYAQTQPNTGKAFSDHALTPRVALLYQPLPNATTYISYIEGFEPNGVVTGDFDNVGDRLKPTTSRQVEYGIKTELLNNRLALTSAIFYIQRNHQLSQDHDNNRLTQRGQQIHQGVEFSAVGHIAHNWQILGSLMYLDARISKDDDPTLIGNTPIGAPHWTVSLWQQYHFSRFNGLSFYGGAFYEGKRQGDDENSFTVPAYTRFDIGVSHEKNWRDATTVLRFNIENLFDTKYFFASDRTNIDVGTPRFFRLSLNVLWR